MANVTVSINTPSITVSEDLSTVTVTNQQSNVIVGETAVIANTVIRASISVTDTGGDGSLTYDSETGVFTYTGPNDSEVRAHFGNTYPVLYDQANGIYSIDEDYFVSTINATAPLQWDANTATMSIDENA